MSLRVRKAVFPVAGLGTRFLPATKVMPKEMLPLVDKPLIQYAIEEARAAGIEDFAFVSSMGKSMMEDHFDVPPVLYETLRERGKTAELDIVKAAEIEAGRLAVFRQHRPLGLGHAVWCARHFVGDEPFAVILPDDVIQSDRSCLAQMTENYQAAGGGILVAVEEVPREHVNRYGILDIDGTVGKLTKVKGLVEKPKPEDAPSNLSIIGRYILPSNIFAELERHERGAGGEIQLTDAMARLIGKVPVHGYSFEGKRFDCGNKVGFIAATLSFALKRPDLSSAVREAIADIL